MYLYNQGKYTRVSWTVHGYTFIMDAAFKRTYCGSHRFVSRWNSDLFLTCVFWFCMRLAFAVIVASFLTSFLSWCLSGRIRFTWAELFISFRSPFLSLSFLVRTRLASPFLSFRFSGLISLTSSGTLCSSFHHRNQWSFCSYSFGFLFYCSHYVYIFVFRIVSICVLYVSGSYSLHFVLSLIMSVCCVSDRICLVYFFLLLFMCTLRFSDRIRLSCLFVPVSLSGRSRELSIFCLMAQVILSKLQMAIIV
jgi:hypothetical protein